MTSKYAWVLLSSCALAACGGRVDSAPAPTSTAPSNQTAPGPGLPAPAASPPPDPDGGTSLDSDGAIPPPPDAPFVSANCSAAPGSAVSFASAQAACDAFKGSWQICSGVQNLGAPADVIGVEFGPAGPETNPAGQTTGGMLYLLVQGASGPVRGVGGNYERTYDVSDEGPGAYQLNIHPACSSGSCGGLGGGFTYSAVPRQLAVQLDFGTFGLSFAAF